MAASSAFVLRMTSQGVDDVLASLRSVAGGSEQAKRALDALSDAVKRGNTSLGELPTEAGKAAAGAKQAERDVARLTAQMDRLAAEGSPAAAALQKVAQVEKVLADAAARGIQPTAQQVQGLEAVRKKNLDLASAANEASGAVKLQAYQVQNLVAQAQDFIVQVGSGQGIFRPLLQQAPQASGAVGGVGNAIALVTQAVTPLRVATLAGAAAVGALAIAYNSQASELGKMQAQLRGVAAEYGGVAKAAVDAAREVSRAGLGVSLGDATAAQVSLRRAAAGSRIGGLDFTALSKQAADLAATLGTDFPSALGKMTAAMRDPVGLVDELARLGFPSMNEQTRLAAERLAEAGRYGDAFALVMGKVKAETGGAAREAMSPFGQALENVKTQFGLIWDDIRNGLAGPGASFLGWLGDVLAAAKNFHDANVEANKRNRETPDPMTEALRIPGNIVRDPIVLPSGTPYGPARPSVTLSQSTSLQDRISAIQAENDRQNLPTNLMLRIARNENNDLSHYNPDGSVRVNAAGGGAGAVGLFQLRGPASLDAGGTPNDRFDPNLNLSMAGRYIANLYKQTGNEDATIAAYKAGLGGYRAQMANGGLDAETRSYLNAAKQPLNLQVQSATIETDKPVQVASSARSVSGDRDSYGPAAVNDVLERALKIARGEIKATGDTRETRVPSLEANLRDVTAGLREASTPEQVDKLTAAQRALNGEIERSLDPQDRMIRQAREAADAANALSPAQAEVTRRMIEYDRTLREQGEAPDPGKRAEYLAQVLRGLQGPFTQAVNDTRLQVESQQRLAEAYGKGGAALGRAQDVEKAMEVVRKTGITDLGQQREAAEKLADEYDRLTRAQNDNTQRASNDSAQANLDYLEKERSLVGATADERERELAAFKARQEAMRRPGGTSESLVQEAESLARKTVDASNQTEQLRNSWDAVGNVVTDTADTIKTALVSAISTGEAKAVSFGNVWKGIQASILANLVQLGAVNPALNYAFGGTRATLGGAFTAFGGAGSAAGGATSQMAGLSGSVSKLSDTVSGLGKIFGGNNLQFNTGIGFIDQTANATAYTTGTATAYGPYSATAPTTPFTGSGAVSYGQAAAGALGVAGGAYGIYQGIQTGGAKGTAQGIAGAASVAGGASTLLGGAAAGGIIAGIGAVAPYVAVAALIASYFLSGQKPSDKTGTSFVNLDTGETREGGLTGKRYSAENRAEATSIAAQGLTLASTYKGLLGVDTIPQAYQVSVGNRDGIGLRIGDRTQEFERTDEGAQQLAKALTSAIIEAGASIASNDIKTVVQSSGGPGDVDTVTANLQWYQTTYKALNETTAEATEAASAYGKQLTATKASYQEVIDKAQELGLGTENVAKKMSDAVAELERQRSDTVQAVQISYASRLAAATGQGGLEAQLSAFDFNATKEVADLVAQLKELGYVAGEANDKFGEQVQLEQALAAEREAGIRQYQLQKASNDNSLLDRYQSASGNADTLAGARWDYERKAVQEWEAAVYDGMTDLTLLART